MIFYRYVVNMCIVERVVSNHYKTRLTLLLETFHTCLKDFKIVHRLWQPCQELHAKICYLGPVL